MDLEFHDAPPLTKGRDKYGPFLDALKANPGKWAKYPTPIHTSYSTMWRRDGFKAVCRNTNGANKCDLWACWPADEAQS